MKKITGISLAASLGTAAFAGPEELNFTFDRVYFDGFLEATVIHGDNAPYSITIGVVDFGIQPKLTGMGVGLGFGVGIDALRINGFGSDRPWAVYGTAEVGTQFGKFSFGVPRSVIDSGYMPVRKFSYSSLVFASSAQDRSLVGDSYLFDDPTVYGARYDGEFGTTKLGLSYHRVKDGPAEADAYALAFSHDLQAVGGVADVALFGGIEVFDLDTGTTRAYRLGAEGDFGNILAGIKRVDYDNFSAPLAWTDLYADYSFNDQLTANISVRAYDSGTYDDVYGIGAEYTFSEFGYVDGGFLDGMSSGTESAYELSVGVKF